MASRYIVFGTIAGLALSACHHASYSQPAAGATGMNPPPAPEQTAAEQEQAEMSSPPASQPAEAQPPDRMARARPPSAGPGWHRGGKERGMWGQHMGSPMMMGMLGVHSPVFILGHSQELGLTDEQVQKIQQDLYAMREKMIDLRARTMKDRLEVRRLLGESKVDQKAIDQRIQDAADAMADARKMQVQAWLNTRASLTPEQTKKLEEMMARAWPGRAQWRAERMYE